jgi:hypothetical protein
MCAEAASIFHRKWDKDVGPSMDPGDGLRGGAVSLKLAVFGLFGCIVRDSRGGLEDGIAVNCSHHIIYHQGANFFKKVENYNVP